MPTYDYRCDGCGHELALFQGIKDDPIKTCPEREEDQLRRLIGSGAGIIFKGSGFYETDYKRARSSSNSSERKDSSESKSSSDSSSDGESKSKSDSKSDSSSSD